MLVKGVFYVTTRTRVKRQDSLTGVKALLQRGSAFLHERGFLIFFPIASRLPHSTTYKTVMVDPSELQGQDTLPAQFLSQHT